LKEIFYDLIKLFNFKPFSNTDENNSESDPLLNAPLTCCDRCHNAFFVAEFDFIDEDFK
jgi:hypothetical protein